MMNNNNTNNNTNMNRVGDQDLNPLTGLNNPFQVQSNTMNGGFGGNLVGPNNPMFNNSNIPSGGMKPQQFIPPPGARFDPIYPTGPFGGVGNGGNRGGSSSSFGNINPDHHKPPQFGDDDF